MGTAGVLPHWPPAWQASLKAGLIAAFLMVLPVVGFGLGMLASGILGVVFYRRQVHGFPIAPGRGARVGALSGSMGFLIFALIVGAELFVPSTRAQFRQAALDALQRAALRSADPQAQQLVEFFSTPQGLALMFIMGAAFLLLLYVVLSSLGGLIAAAFYGRRPLPAPVHVESNDAKGPQNEEQESSEQQLRPK